MLTTVTRWRREAAVSQAPLDGMLMECRARGAHIHHQGAGAGKEMAYRAARGGTAANK